MNAKADRSPAHATHKPQGAKVDINPYLRLLAALATFRRKLDDFTNYVGPEIGTSQGKIEVAVARQACDLAQHGLQLHAADDALAQGRTTWRSARSAWISGST